MVIVNGIKKTLKTNEPYQNYTQGTYTESDKLKDLNKQSDYWSSQELKNFTWDDSMLGADYNNWSNQLNALQKPEWNGYSKQGDWDNILNKITNMKDFSYDVNGDALYQQYKDQYTTQGKMAMMDTMGQAAALTGGYGNSYAQSVGQQTFQGYMQQLTDKVPELYSLALSKYNSDKDDLYRQSDLHQNLFNNEYGMYRNDVSDYNTNRDYITGRMDTAYNRDYNTALAENESYNSNLTSNRNYYTDAANALANQEWGKYVDNENLATQAIKIYNDNLAQQKSEALQREQFNWNKSQSNLQAQVDALTNQYVYDDAKVRSVSEGILSEEDFKANAERTLGKRKQNQLGIEMPSFVTTYNVDGVSYDSYEDYVKDMLNLAYDNGKGFNEATLNKLFDKYKIEQ